MQVRWPIQCNHTLASRCTASTQGMDLHFKRHDGQDVTCEDFFSAMRDANDADFANFLLWYSQAGTPTVKVNTSYNPEAHVSSLKISQEIPPLDLGHPEPFVCLFILILVASNLKDSAILSL